MSGKKSLSLQAEESFHEQEKTHPFQEGVTECLEQATTRTAKYFQMDAEDFRLRRRRGRRGNFLTSEKDQQQQEDQEQGR